MKKRTVAILSAVIFVLLLGCTVYSAFHFDRSLPIVTALAPERGTVNGETYAILVPAAKGGLVGLILLTFVDVWNMVEQPMVFLQNARDYPLGVFLAVQSGEAISLAGSLLSMLPVLLLFLYYRDELSEGVEFLGVKG